MDKLFKLRERGTSVSREVIGGITTFLAMSYILAVNPGILSAAGLEWGAIFTATAISLAMRENIAERFASNAPFFLLMVDHLLCPDIVVYCYNVSNLGRKRCVFGVQK